MFRTEIPLLYESAIEQPTTELTPEITIKKPEPEGFKFDWLALAGLILIGAVILWFTLE